jgi:hypothetical protein
LIRFSERLAEAGIQPSVGAVGSSYDNAPAETINGLYKTELIRPCKPWPTIEEVEPAVLRRNSTRRTVDGLLRSKPETSRWLSSQNRKSPDSPGRFSESADLELKIVDLQRQLGDTRGRTDEVESKVLRDIQIKIGELKRIQLADLKWAILVLFITALGTVVLIGTLSLDRATIEKICSTFRPCTSA